MLFLAIVGAVGGAAGTAIGAILDKEAKYQEKINIKCGDTWSPRWSNYQSKLYKDYGYVENNITPFLRWSEVLLNVILGYESVRYFFVLRPFYFGLTTSTYLLRLAYFDRYTNLNLLLVDMYRSK